MNAYLELLIKEIKDNLDRPDIVGEMVNEVLVDYDCEHLIHLDYGDAFDEIDSFVGECWDDSEDERAAMMNDLLDFMGVVHEITFSWNK